MKNSKTSIDYAAMQPDELNALKLEVREFIKRLSNVDNELMTLREDRKTLIEEFSGKLDVKTLQLAMKIVKLESTVDHKDSYETFKELLVDDFVNDLVGE